jgi:arylsulfatase A-like enzyme
MYRVILILSILFSLCSCNVNTAEEDKPNVLFLVIEDSSQYLFPAYGNQDVKTPNLDFLSDNGVVFDNAFSNGPQCSPARSSLISGSYATTYGCDWHRNKHLVPEQYFFPKYLREAGYFTVNAGKTDYNITIGMQKKYYPVAWDLLSGNISGDTMNVTYNDSIRGDKPFFAQFNNATTHMSRMTTVNLNNRAATTINPNSITLPPHVPDLPAIRSDYALHLDGIASADKWVGLFLKDLRDRKLLDNTIIFFFSDHGGCLPRGKAFPYETGFRPALMVYAPEKWQHLLPAKAGSRTDRLVEFSDFGPTLLSIAGVKTPHHMQGKAFMGQYAKEERDVAFCFRTNTGDHFDPSRSALDGNFQYIRNYTPYKVHALKQSFQWGMPAQIAWDSLYYSGNCIKEYQQYYQSKPVEQLFDSKNDPFGIVNLAERAEYQEVLVKLRKKVSDHIRETKDIGFLPIEVRDSLTKEGIALYDYVRNDNYPLDELHNLVEKASETNPDDQEFLIRNLSHPKTEFRFWAASGLANHANNGLLKGISNELIQAVSDKSKCIQATAAEAMVYAGEKKGINLLLNQAKRGNVLAMSSLEELGKQVQPYLSEIKELSVKSKNKEIRFLARGILINFGQLEQNELFENKAVKSFVKTHQKRIREWAPTRP